MPVIWGRRALADIGRIVSHIAEERPATASRIGRELLLAGDSLIMFPQRGRRGSAPDTRELVVVGPYVLIYEVSEHNSVYILRIWHAAQDRR